MLKKLHGRKLAVCLIGGAMYALFSAFGWQAEHGGVIWAENIRPTNADKNSPPLGARFVVGLPL